MILFYCGLSSFNYFSPNFSYLSVYVLSYIYFAFFIIIIILLYFIFTTTTTIIACSS